jgi:hypothetical protein
MKIIRKTKNIYGTITDKAKGISLFRELTILLYIAAVLPNGLNDKIVDPLYQELKKIKKNKKIDYRYIEGDFYYPIIRETKEFCKTDKKMVEHIQREADRISKEWKEEESQDLELWRDTVILQGEWIRTRYLNYERRFNKEYVEPEKTENFGYILGGYEEINFANKWKRNVGIMEKQREEQNKKSYMQVENKEKSKMKVIIVQEITK